MRIINIIGGLVVLVCNIWVSFAHSIALFHSGGFSGGLAYIGVIGAETTFLMGALNLVVSKFKGQNPGGPAIVGFLLGVSLILWSNISAGITSGLTGVILGGVVPVSLIIAEGILTKAIFKAPEGLQQPEEYIQANQPNPTTQSDQPTKVVPTIVVPTKPVPTRVVQNEPLVELVQMYYKENGHYPSRRQFANLASITEYKSYQILTIAKQSASVTKN